MSLKSKPSSPGRVNNLLACPQAQVTISANDFLQELRAGSAFCSGLRADDAGWGRRKTNFDANSLLFLDIDSGVDWQTEAEVSYNVIQKGVLPTFIYKTFSWASEHPRWRVLFALARPIADAELVSRMQLGLHELFPFTDRLFDCTRVLYPGLGCSYFDSKAINEPAKMPLPSAMPSKGSASQSKGWSFAEQDGLSLEAMSPWQRLAIAGLLDTVFCQLACPPKDEHGQHKFKRWQCIRFRTAELASLRVFSRDAIIDFVRTAIAQKPEAWADYQNFILSNIEAGFAIADSAGAQTIPDPSFSKHGKHLLKAKEQTLLWQEFTKVYKPVR